MKDYKGAIAAHDKMVVIVLALRFSLGHTYALAGRRDEARKILAELEAEEVTPYGAWGLAQLYTILGEKDKAFQWLNYEQPHAFFPWVRIMPVFESLRSDPRFKELLRKMNLPELE